MHSNRAAARIELGQFLAALQDAQRSRACNPCWDKASSRATARGAHSSASQRSSASHCFLQAYLREAAALVCLHRPAEAVAALRAGLLQVRQSVCLQEALAALPGLAGAPTRAGLPAPCEAAAAQGSDAPGSAGEPGNSPSGRSTTFAGRACEPIRTLPVVQALGGPSFRSPSSQASWVLGEAALCLVSCTEHAPLAAR